MREFILDIIKRFIVSLLSTLGVITLYGIILEKLESLVNSNLYKTIGYKTVLFTAAVGTPVHETSHFLMCKLFRFPVMEVQFLRPKQYKYDGILGYVSYIPIRHNWLSDVGFVLVGLAPMLLGILFIFLFVWLLTPEVYDETKRRFSDAISKSQGNIFIYLWSGFSGFFCGLFTLRTWGILRGLLMLYIVMSISMHMTISSADIQNSTRGLPVLLGVYFVIAIISATIGNAYLHTNLKIAVYISAFFTIGIFFDGLLLLIGYIASSLLPNSMYMYYF